MMTTTTTTTNTTTPSKVLDDDGYELSPYEVQRLERIRKNNAYLEKLGLGATKQKMMEMTKKTKRNQQREQKRRQQQRQLCPPGQERRSGRLRQNNSNSNKKRSLVMLSYDDDEERAMDQDYDVSNDDDEEQGEEVEYERPTKRFRRYDPSLELSNDERQVLSNNMDDNYLHKFKEFLVYHNKISDQNVRNVMRQVTKLATGQGIRYESARYGWPDGCYFLKGVKVTPMSDIVQLMQEGQEAEDKWGRDHGNGWLLSHPLKKLLLFQQFALNNPDFLTARCKLKDYYDESSSTAAAAEEDDENEDSTLVMKMSKVPSARTDPLEDSVLSSSATAGSKDTRATRDSCISSNPAVVTPPPTTCATTTANSENSDDDDDDSLSCKKTLRPKQLQVYSVGTKMARQFPDGKVYSGKVNSFDDSTGYYLVVYDEDGDEEELTLEEMKQYIQKRDPVKKERQQQRRGGRTSTCHKKSFTRGRRSAC